MKLWAGRFSKGLNEVADSFNSSISFDYKLLEHDLQASRVHAEMLAKQGIISVVDGEKIDAALSAMLEELAEGNLAVDWTAEDVHSFIEGELTARTGEAGKRLHTGRSRNDQVATAMKLYAISAGEQLQHALVDLVQVLTTLATGQANTILPGYTHLQRAQPITFGHHLLAYAHMFLRDITRLQNNIALAKEECPLGSGALAGTTYPIDRSWCATELGFDAPSGNSMDGVSDRDFLLDILHSTNLIMLHLSRFSEEIILWCSWEFQFIRLDDAFSTGSSIMPQKKNPDVAELVRGKSGRVFGDYLSLLTTMKGLPLAYNKDMQEDKEVFFDSTETALACLQVFTPMLETIEVLPHNMALAAANGFINATDCADYLVTKGLAFRDAYKITGELVAYCIASATTLENLPLATYQEFSTAFDDTVYEAIDLTACVNRRTSYGAPATVNRQVADINHRLAELKRSIPHD